MGQKWKHSAVSWDRSTACWAVGPEIGKVKRLPPAEERKPKWPECGEGTEPASVSKQRLPGPALTMKGGWNSSDICLQLWLYKAECLLGTGGSRTSPGARPVWLSNQNSPITLLLELSLQCQTRLWAWVVGLPGDQMEATAKLSHRKEWSQRA